MEWLQMMFPSHPTVNDTIAFGAPAPAAHISSVPHARQTQQLGVTMGRPWQELGVTMGRPRAHISHALELALLARRWTKRCNRPPWACQLLTRVVGPTNPTIDKGECEHIRQGPQVWLSNCGHSFISLSRHLQTGVHLSTDCEPDSYGHIQFVKHKGQLCIAAMASITGHGASSICVAACWDVA